MLDCVFAALTILVMVMLSMMVMMMVVVLSMVLFRMFADFCLCYLLVHSLNNLLLFLEFLLGLDFSFLMLMERLLYSLLLLRQYLNLILDLSSLLMILGVL